MVVWKNERGEYGDLFSTHVDLKMRSKAENMTMLDAMRLAFEGGQSSVAGAETELYSFEAWLTEFAAVVLKEAQAGTELVVHFPDRPMFK
jgi:hypothetical protein